MKDTELLPFLRYLGRLFQLFCDLETCMKHTVYGDTHKNLKSRQLTSFTIYSICIKLKLHFGILGKTERDRAGENLLMNLLDLMSSEQKVTLTPTPSSSHSHFCINLFFLLFIPLDKHCYSVLIILQNTVQNCPYLIHCGIYNIMTYSI